MVSIKDLVEATFIAIYVNLFLFGAYCALFCGAMVILMMKPREERGHMHKFWVISSTVLFLIAFMNSAIYCHQGISAFIFNFGNAFGTFASISNFKDWGFLTCSLLITTQIFIADAILIFRIWVVWDRNRWVVVLPTISLVGTVVCSIQMALTMRRINGPGGYPLLCSVYGLAMTTSLYCSGMIAGRIWWHLRRTRSLVTESASSRLSSVISAFVESAVLYSITMLIGVISVATYQTVLNVIMWYTITPVIGITFSLILIRIGLGVDYSQNKQVLTMTLTPSSSASSKTRVTGTVITAKSAPMFEDVSKNSAVAPWMCERSASSVDLFDHMHRKDGRTGGGSLDLDPASQTQESA